MGRLGRVVVEGNSMSPQLAPGDRLLVIPARRLRVGDVVALVDPCHPSRELVKRVTGLDGNRYLVLGDNLAASTDSRAFGPVPPTAIRGRAVYRYFPPHRAGPLPARSGAGRRVRFVR